MLFADLLFIYGFFVLCFIAYFAFKSIKARNAVLIFFSLLFYAYGEPKRIVIYLLGIAVNYALSLLLAPKNSPRKRKTALVISILFNIGMLAVFKYTDFVIDNINSIFGASIKPTGIVMLVGISFYTFRMISYMVDVYWEKVELQRNFGKLLLFISLFPTVTAGPIVRYTTIGGELTERTSSVNDIYEGFMRVICGLSKKVIISDNLGLLVNKCFGENISEASVAATWVGVIAYTLQVYYDFSGYSDIAIGMGRIFGFHFDENFNYPFICRSISEFWQRWHMSLGSFFRDYLLYLPIFGHRLPTVSLFLVWFTTGLWHGASWNYVIWGLYFGVFIYIETLLGKKRLKKIPTPIMHIYNKLVIIIGFGIFEFTSMADMGNFFKNLVGANGNAFTNDAFTAAVTPYLFLLLLAVAASFPIFASFKKRLASSGEGVQSAVMICGTAVAIALLFIDTALIVKALGSNVPFLYAKNF